MKSLVDPAVRQQLRERLLALRPDAQRQWGAMTADQMLWHLVANFDMALGRASCPPVPMPVPRAVARFIGLRMPWPKGAPTAPALLARGTYDFEEQRQRCLTAIEEMAARPVDGQWPDHPAFGRLTGPQWMQLEAKHVDHHLRQFGA